MQISVNYYNKKIIKQTGKQTEKERDGRQRQIDIQTDRLKQLIDRDIDRDTYTVSVKQLQTCKKDK